RLRTFMSNVYCIATSSRSWVLVDTGMPGFARAIARAAKRLFDSPPLAILLTHGHFDHVGGLPYLADSWGVPIYAHPLELPYVTGRSSYAPADPAVGGGSQSWLSAFYSRGPIDLGTRVRMLPEDGGVPHLRDWVWLRTDGHSPGHVSLFREADRVLVAGDAVVTTKQESMLSALRQREVVWRPPAYFTPDWEAARRSIETLAALDPDVLATGHGRVLRGPLMRAALRLLDDNFDLAMPSTGRYIPYPAVADERGLVHVPPRIGLSPGQRAAAVGIGAAAAALAWFSLQALASRLPRRRQALQS
ncbi:MAG TPA: MBL fold metallo-hydrolase, partial [Vicinamibacterales bacterium]